MTTNFKNGLEVFGAPILPGAGGNIFTGNVFFVDSGSPTSSDEAGQGTKKTAPFSTLDFAVGQCTANNGDLIIVMPGHVETVIAAGGLDLDVAGITILGLGSGSDRPTVNFTTAVGADMDVDAANVTIGNVLFTGGIDALTGPIDVNAADFKMLGCETRDVTGQATDFIVTDANADRFECLDWVHRGAAAAGAATAMSIVGGDNITIIPRFVDGNFSVGCIENVTTAAVNLQVFGRGDYPAYMRTRNAADVIVTCVATTTGRQGPFLNARLQDNAANITEAFVGADMNFYQPINLSNLDGESSMQTNITASTDA